MPAGPLLDDIADIALPLDHPLAGESNVELTALAGDAWISWPSGCICHDWLMQAVRRGGREPKVRHQALEYATQLALVGAGLGVAVLPRLGRGMVPADVRIVTVTPTLARHVHAIWRRDAARKTAILATVEAFRSAADAFCRVT